MKKFDVIGWIVLAFAAMYLASPEADAAPNVCSAPGAVVWSNPCTAVTPPWWSDNWRPTNGIGGTWGPGGYTPCRIQEGCKP